MKNNQKILLLFLVTIGIMVTIGSVSAFFGSGDSNATPLLTEGSYKVGQDIDPGEYYAVCNGYNMYIAVSKDSSGTLDSINYNLNTEGNVYITLKEGEYLEISGGEIYDLSDAPYTKPENGVLTEGMYKVGEDIAPGEYTLDAINSGYIEVRSDSRHDLNGITTNDNFETNKIITVSEGQYILFNRAELKISDSEYLR